MMLCSRISTPSCLASLLAASSTETWNPMMTASEALASRMSFAETLPTALIKMLMLTLSLAICLSE